MDKKLWNAIHDLLDAAEYALGPLANHSDWSADDHGIIVPNGPASAHSLLLDTMVIVCNMMPPCPETPAETELNKPVDMGR